MLCCSSGHRLSLAKGGYAHFLPPAKKKVAAGAESDAIIRASRTFYESGGFDVQAEGVATEVLRALSCSPGGTPMGAQVLAVGCGEGFYLRQVAAHLHAAVETEAGADQQELSKLEVGLWGTDKSKLAVRYAATRQPRAQFAVASPHRLPFADGSFDVVFSCFSSACVNDPCRLSTSTLIPSPAALFYPVTSDAVSSGPGTNCVASCAPVEPWLSPGLGRSICKNYGHLPTQRFGDPRRSRCRKASVRRTCASAQLTPSAETRPASSLR